MIEESACDECGAPDCTPEYCPIKKALDEAVKAVCERGSASETDEDTAGHSAKSQNQGAGQRRESVNLFEPRYRCPKNGRWASEGDCMFCDSPPKNLPKHIDPDDFRDFCWEYNTIEVGNHFESRWDSRGRRTAQAPSIKEEASA